MHKRSEVRGSTFNNNSCSERDLELREALWMVSEDLVLSCKLFFRLILRLLGGFCDKLAGPKSGTCIVGITTSITGLFISTVVVDSSNALTVFNCFDWAGPWPARFVLAKDLILFFSWSNSCNAINQNWLLGLLFWWRYFLKDFKLASKDSNHRSQYSTLFFLVKDHRVQLRLKFNVQMK